MTSAHPGFRWKLAAAIGCFLTIAGCVIWVDRPAELWAFEHVRQRGVFVAINYLLYPIMAFVCLRLAGYGIGAIFFGRKSYRLDTAFGCCLAVAIALTLTETLKVVTGRIGPESFQGSPSWIRDGIYGFFPFHLGPGYAYFPSGHTSITAAFAGVLWMRKPKLRVAWLALTVAMMVSLVAAGWHWISDTIAGLALGLFCARSTATLLRWDAPPVPHDPK
ncbi:MAG: phosphatase PAP2 family protein [Nibricoccus sp.]